VGNRRFVEGRAAGPNRSMTRLKDVAPQQAPFAAVLSCADSRVPVEILFDQGFGDLFVCRAAGNIVTPELLASLEFGTLVLGARALVVLGHTSCGAVKATIDGTAVPGQISALYQHIQPAVERVAANGTVQLEAVAQENVRLQARLLTRSSPVIAGLVREGKLAVAGGMYDLATGRVTMLGV
jgi:carbonic anhydrase